MWVDGEWRKWGLMVSGRNVKQYILKIQMLIDQCIPIGYIERVY